MNAIRKAFQDNGIIPAEDRLQAVALDLAIRHPDDWDKLMDAFLSVVTRDLALLEALTRTVIKAQARLYLLSALNRARQDNAASKSKDEQKPVEGSWTKDRPANAGGARAEVSGGGHKRRDGSSVHLPSASPAHAKPAYVRPTAAQRAEQQRETNISVAEVRSRALLDRVMPGMDKPFAAMTLEELRPWASRYSEHGRFISLVISNMTAPTQRVEDCYRDDTDLRTYEALARQAVRADAGHMEVVH